MTRHPLSRNRTGAIAACVLSLVLASLCAATRGAGPAAPSAHTDANAPVAPTAPAAPDGPAAANAAEAEAERAPEAASDKSDDFVRFVPDAHGGGTLQAAIVTYRNADGVAVHLVSALHVGEKSYYDGLSKTFEGYDALLYELVKPKGAAAPPPGARPGGMVTMFQRFLTDVLELHFQLDAIDYSAPNFVHADLDAETFLALQEKRGESLLTLMLRSMISEMQRQQQGGGAAPISIFE